MIINPYRYAASGSAWSPSDKNANITLSNANKTASNIAFNSWAMARAVFFASSGQKYYEASLDVTDTAINAYMLGVGKSGASLADGEFVGRDANGWGWQMTPATPKKWNNLSSANYGAQAVVNDIISVLLDIGAGTLIFWLNGSTQGTAYSGLSGTFLPMCSMIANNGTRTITARFAAADWTYSPPGGYTEWS